MGSGGLGFVTSQPTRPGGVDIAPPRRKLGVDYDTAWARRYPVRLARAIVLDDFSRPVLKVVSRLGSSASSTSIPSRAL